MELLMARFFCVLVATGLASGESLYYKLPKDHDPSKEIRGNSFGLENFLLQAYKDVDTVNVEATPPPKRTREKDAYKKREPTNHRGQTYGLENLAPSLYNLGQPSLGLSDYVTDYNSANDHPKWIASEPETVKTKENERRNKVRKPGKHVVRRPVSKPTEPPTPSTTERVEEPQNVDLDYGQPTPIVREAEAGGLVAEASYAIPKTQEIPVSEKDVDQPQKQRPRKRVTMRRRKRPNQNSQDGETGQQQPNETGFGNDVRDNFDVLKESETIPALSTSTSTTTTSTTTTSTTTTTTTTTTPPPTTTVKARTDKERPNRRKPGGFRRVPADDQNYSQTTPVYRNDLESNESNTPTTNTPEVIEYSEEPFVRTSTTTTPRSTSSEETSAADLKTFLKQQNGPLSLSELLQTQNLSLADFLKNRKEAALLLSGRRGSTTQRPDSREHIRNSFNTKSRPFTRTRQDPESDDSRSSERVRSTEATTTSTDRYTYNGFVPKNPRGRHGHFKGVYPTVKSNFGSEEKSNESRDRLRESQENRKSDFKFDKSINQVTTEPTRPRIEVKNIPKRFNDLRLKLRIHRRKYNPHSTTNSIDKESKTESSTTPATTVTVSSTQTTREKVTTTEEVPTTKKLGIRIPFKSSNNPELSLILPNKNKSEEKVEKRERFSSYSSRLQTSKKSSQEKDDLSKESNNIEETTTSKVIMNETKLPLDDIEMDDDDKDTTPVWEPKLNTERPKEEKDKSTTMKVEVVGRIPLPSEQQKYESKDEILELLKPGSNSDRLQRILESRNMTVKELLENREKSSLQTNFTQLFNKDDLLQQRRNEIKTTTTPDPTFKVFQSLPDFHPIHRNLFQKNVKDLKSNSYPDSVVDESRPIPVISSTTHEPRGSKQLTNVVEVKKKLLLNSESESRDSLEGNDGVLDRWNTREKVLLYNVAFTTEKKPLPTLRPILDFPLNGKKENNVEESDIILLETIKRSQEANRKLKSNINEILQEQSQVKEIKSDIDKSFIPPAVKSAIIASSVVLGLAMFVFVAIFAACGWKQRQIRLRARSSILNDALAKSDSEKKVQRTSALSPVFKQPSVYKKSLEADNESSSGASISSNASSYLWNTLKNTFAGRTTLKSRLDKESKPREDRLEGLKTVLRSHETRRSDILVEEDGSEEIVPKTLLKQEERFSMRKNDYIKRSPSFTTSSHFSSCSHGH
ncbi:UNVERIFIED_CONTAM: hypothetical protein PYX00_001781 [Menopon gallinae]|uniref:Uncharacterized protein n=1 Tax=Menopon gallinae TaxID=328185 RepID=A0AAW2IDV1_9NEOP